MNVYDLISRAMPGGAVKDLLRRAFYGLAYRLTVGTYRLEVAGQMARFHRPLLLPDFNPAEHPQTYFVRHTPAAGEVVVDAGAFHGHFAVPACRLVGDAGMVVCFEPDPDNARLLLRNLRLNGCHNARVVCKGLGNASGQRVLLPHGPGTRLADKAEAHPRFSRRVETARLDDEMAALGRHRADMIKMDIEGAEIEALRGASRLLAAGNVHLAIASYHLVDGRPTSDRVEALLRAMGYEVATSAEGHRTTYAGPRP